MGGRIDWGFGIDRYTLLYLKQIINKDLLHSTANPARKKKVKSQIGNIKEWE